MSKAVIIQNPESIYDDRPGLEYHFPRRYLGVLSECVGDWVVIYEGRTGAFGYVAVQKLLEIVPDKQRPDHFYARLDQQSLWSFERVVPRSDASGRAFEHSLRRPGGKPMSGGANVSAVRRLSEAEFAAIVGQGLMPIQQPDAYPRTGPLPVDHHAKQPGGFSEAASDFSGPELVTFRPEILTSRKARDASFARQVKHAYGGRCAISGLDLRNGGGRPEVEAAHIRPVHRRGPDDVRNGIALSGTLHWMFDRGLISVAQDYSILVSHNKVPEDTAARLIRDERRLRLPKDSRLHPHPEYLRFHREEVFGQFD